MIFIVALIISAGISADANAKLPLQDDGFGKCPAFSHYHPTIEELNSEEMNDLEKEGHEHEFILLDGKCHRDDDDSTIKDAPRKILPKPNQKWKWL